MLIFNAKMYLCMLKTNYNVKMSRKCNPVCISECQNLLQKEKKSFQELPKLQFVFFCMYKKREITFLLDL